MEIKVNVPCGKSGEWAVSEMIISDADAAWHAMRCAMKGVGYRAVRPGTYKKLTHKGNVIMSNTPAECNDHWEIIYRAKDHVLINGLGLGVVLTEILKPRKNRVTKVTVVEISEDVIKLVGPTFTPDSRVEIIHADAFEYQPPKGIRYGAVWHDIWPDINSDYLVEMARLHRKYGRRCEWQGSWSHWECLRQRRQEKRDAYWM